MNQYLGNEGMKRKKRKKRKYDCQKNMPQQFH